MCGAPSICVSANNSGNVAGSGSSVGIGITSIGGLLGAGDGERLAAILIDALADAVGVAEFEGETVGQFGETDADAVAELEEVIDIDGVAEPVGDKVAEADGVVVGQLGVKEVDGVGVMLDELDGDVLMELLMAGVAELKTDGRILEEADGVTDIELDGKAELDGVEEPLGETDTDSDGDIEEELVGVRAKLTEAEAEGDGDTVTEGRIEKLTEAETLLEKVGDGEKLEISKKSTVDGDGVAEVDSEGNGDNDVEGVGAFCDLHVDANRPKAAKSKSFLAIMRREPQLRR